MNSIKNTVADNLRIYRKANELSQERLGELCGLHRTYIGNIEQQKGNVSIENIERISHALHIDPALLFIDAPKEAVEASKKRGKSAKTALDALGFKPGGYALCSWKGEKIALEPLSIIDQNLAISILVALIDQGLTDNLPATVKEMQERILGLASSMQTRSLS